MIDLLAGHILSFISIAHSNLLPQPMFLRARLDIQMFKKAVTEGAIAQDVIVKLLQATCSDFNPDPGP